MVFLLVFWASSCWLFFIFSLVGCGSSFIFVLVIIVVLFFFMEWFCRVIVFLYVCYLKLW